MNKIKVLVVDDIEIVRTGYQIIFSKSSNIEICGTATNGDEAIKLYAALGPDVVLMDIMMPVKDGIKTCKELVFKNEDAKVILNTAFVKEEIINKVLSSGAKGLLLKDAEPAEIEKAIVTASQGGEYYNKNVLEILIRKLVRTNSDSLKEYWGNHFSPREVDIIQLTSQGLTSAEIGKKLNLGKRTIEVSRSATLKKMKVKSIVEMIIQSYKIGLLDINQ